ncbi:MAG: hypothetical protein EOO45_24870 [Flavobacterium sp.]|nr:MAG: hypothetical protein EOO45_24870 [Flavobacterium sp.]
MEEKYATFKKYPDAAQARELQQYLISNGIECLFADVSPTLDSSFSSSHLKEYEVQLKPEDFEKAHGLLEKHAEEMVAALGEDYYLFSFTDEELYEVIVKQDEWSEFDYVLARKLLADRGKAIDEMELRTMRVQRIEELAKPQENHMGWIAAGYIMALLGGFFGIIIGYVIWTSGKTLPNGQYAYTYTHSGRKQGKIIFILGIVVLTAVILSQVFKKYLSLN